MPQKQDMHGMALLVHSAGMSISHQTAPSIEFLLRSPFDRTPFQQFSGEEERIEARGVLSDIRDVHAVAAQMPSYCCVD